MKKKKKVNSSNKSEGGGKKKSKKKKGDGDESVSSEDASWGGEEEEEEKLEIRLEISKDDHETFKLMLKYMYTGETDFITEKNVLPIISVSNHFGIDSLKEVCGGLLGELVDDDNIVFFLDLCDRYQIHELESACGEHLAENFDELLNENRLLALPPTTWAEILKSDELQIKSEEHLFDVIIKYTEQWKKR